MVPSFCIRCVSVSDKLSIHVDYVSRRSSKTVSSGDVACVKTPEVAESNAVMYDEVGMNHLTTANEISLTKNSAYSSTKEA